MASLMEMRVTKRNGDLEDISFDKILNRIKKLASEDDIHINFSSLVMKVIDQLYDKISTSKIDELAAEQCIALSTLHTNYSKLASRIVISNHQKNTNPLFSEVMKKLFLFKDTHGLHKPLLQEEVWNFIEKNQIFLNNLISHSRDYLIDYFGFKTLERAYLFRINNVIQERIQHMWLRVSIGIHFKDNDNDRALKAIEDTYHLMSQKYYTHATPTLFNSGTPRPQLSSCFLLGMEDDSLEGIYNTLKDTALISKWAGGIGLHIHNVRAKGSHIQGTNGSSNGIVPMLRVFNNTARYVDQCVTPDTFIYTLKGPVEIQNVISNETKIFNSTGKDETVLNVLEHSYEGEMLSIKNMHSLEPLKVTPEHPIYVLQGQEKGLNFNVIKKRLEHESIKCKFIEAKELNTNDFTVFSIPTYERDISSITQDDCYLYGILLGDGCMSSSNFNGYISLNSESKKEVIQFVEQYFSSKCVQYSIIDGNSQNVKRIRWNKNISLPFRQSDLYNENKEKRIENKWLHLPIEKIKFIVKGLIDSDCCKQNEIIFDNTSRLLIEGLRYLLLRMGILTSGYKRNRIDKSHKTKYGSTIINHKLAYTLRIPKTKEINLLLNLDSTQKEKFQKFFRYKNLLFSRIKSIKQQTYHGTLYDLQMNEIHDYMIHNGIIHNGGGKRNGSFAIYLEPWHADIEDFLEMKKNHGDEEMKGRDLFYALWTNDLFMERIKSNGNWSLFCPHECPHLSDKVGNDFKELYEHYESQNKARKVMTARSLWFKILDAQMETGVPYILYKDSANLKSNQQNLGVIKSSNLCCEIIEYSDKHESAVCNLASIALPSFVDKKTKQFDYEKLEHVTRIITRNLNKVIDTNYYPTYKTRRSNLKHRPIGIGVQGLADTFVLMDESFHSENAKEINKLIFETIYYASLKESNELAIERRNLIIEILEKKVHPFDYQVSGDFFNEFEPLPSISDLNLDLCGSYTSFQGSPASKGNLQFDMWNITPTMTEKWSQLKQSIKQFGIRNSLLVAPMPTASTSQILGFNECFEPFTSNIYTRRTLAGEFVVINKYLMNELMELNLWNEDIKNNIIANKGSIQQLTHLPEKIRNKYKIVWEIPMKHLIDMSADRGAYICQTQSLNLWMEDPTYNQLTSMHFYSWQKGLKTGIYYLRRKAKHQAQQFTIEPEQKKNDEEDEICEMCSA